MKFPVDILFQMLYTIFAVDETDKQLAERSGAGMLQCRIKRSESQNEYESVAQLDRATAF